MTQNELQRFILVLLTQMRKRQILRTVEYLMMTLKAMKENNYGKENNRKQEEDRKGKACSG